MKAKVYCNGIDYYTDDIDISHININIDNYCIGNIADKIDYLDMFRDTHIVRDVHRYNVTVLNGDINCVKIEDNFSISGNNLRILLILESPHIKEYEKNPTNSNDLNPKAPAQGKTGKSIDKYIEIVLRKIIDLNCDADYELIISNPISYMCSLGIFTTNFSTRFSKHDSKKHKRNICNNVWKTIWDIKINNDYIVQEDFVARCRLYNPRYIINCCTDDLTCFVSALLAKNGFIGIYKTYHPSVQWNTLKGNIPVDKIV